MKPPIGDALRQMFGEALERHANLDGHDRFEWDLGPFACPQPNGTTVAASLLHVWVPSPIVGQWFSNTVVITDPHVATAEGVDRLIDGLFETFSLLRSRVLAGGNGHHVPPLV